MAQALGRAAHVRKPERAPADLDRYDMAAIGRVLEGQSGALPQKTVKGVLEAAGLKLRRQMEVFKCEDLVLNGAQVGFPLAMKVIVPLHKTDVGGVKPGIANDEDALRSWSTIFHKLQKSI